MTDPYNLRRFVDAQAPVMHRVRYELREGRKRSHWMWFVFPQLCGLGHSATAQFYAIGSIGEALAYLRHVALGPRLIECTTLVNAIEGRTIEQIFGTPDDLKFHSCMTLFAALDTAPPVFEAALKQYFGAVPDRLTTAVLAASAAGKSSGVPGS